jgi:hypothetical protein
MLQRLWLFFVLLVSVLAACTSAAPTSTPTATPTLLPSLTPTALPSLTPTLGAEPISEATPETTVETLALTPLAGFGVEPPVTMTFPDGWGYHIDTFALADVADLRAIPVVYYEGPIAGGAGVGKIYLFWGFPNLVDPFPDDATTLAPNLWSDGLRLFRLAMVDPGCNSGTDIQRTYRIGNQSAVGTQFSIVDCPESPDTRGWFAGTQVNGLNFVFFVLAEPIETMEVADEELQSILNSAVFNVPEQ